MSKFVDIYLAAVKKKSLKDEIEVREIGNQMLPLVVREAIERRDKNKEFLRKMEERDSREARERLEKLKEQVGRVVRER